MTRSWLHCAWIVPKGQPKGRHMFFLTHEGIWFHESDETWARREQVRALEQMAGLPGQIISMPAMPVQLPVMRDWLDLELLIAGEACQ